MHPTIQPCAPAADTIEFEIIGTLSATSTPRQIAAGKRSEGVGKCFAMLCEMDLFSKLAMRNVRTGTIIANWYRMESIDG